MSDTRYLVAARKYRPQRFADVVAQEHVTATLTNALKMDRLAHAYLFSGPRGVGKTTVARILAKSINCEVPLEERADAEPCGECQSCTSLSEGRSLNVIEIDAASNNKVDDVRELRDTVRIPPQGARKKVYIVDEVHMLSNSAFNAFLKTLEEPPPYALFIFATTEPRKVIPTILSRCQRFDFKRIPVSETVERLRDIAAREEIIVDDASLMLIAQKGDGALRDALSVFDQAVSLCGNDISYQALTQALRVVDQELFFDATSNVLKGNSAGMLDLVESIASGGYDLQEFLAGLAGHVRNLLVAVTTGETKLIEATDADRKRFADHAAKFTETQLLRMLMLIGQTEENVSRSTQPRLTTELGLLKMASLLKVVDVRSALARLDTLEKQVASVVRSSRTDNSSSRKPEPPVSESSGSNSQDGDNSPIREETDDTAVEFGDGARDSSKSKAQSKPAAAPKADSTGRKESRKKGETISSPDENPPKGAASESPGLFGPPALKKKAASDTKKNSEVNVIEGSLAVSVDPAHRIPDSIESIWLKYVSTVKSIRIHVGSLLQHAAPVDVRKASVIVAVPDEFHRRLLDNQQEFLLKHLNSASEIQYKKIEFVIREMAQEGGSENSDSFDPYEYMKRKRQESPIVKAIFEDFGGELVW